MSADFGNGSQARGISGHIGKLDWGQIAKDLDANGCALIEGLMPRHGCAALARSYSRQDIFRSRVVMSQHGFGRGEYKYFSYPLPATVASLRTAFYPASHLEFIARCHAAGQVRPTPLLLQYDVDDYNCLHQDLYGEHVFPLQVAVLLSEPGRDFTGGEFVLTEQRPRMQSRPQVVPLRQGDAVVFAVCHRPVKGTRGSYRATMRHGVSRLRSGKRHTVGIIFHDAE